LICGSLSPRCPTTISCTSFAESVPRKARPRHAQNYPPKGKTSLHRGGGCVSVACHKGSFRHPPWRRSLLSSLPLPCTMGGGRRGFAGLEPALVLATGFSRWSLGQPCSPSRAGFSRASRPEDSSESSLPNTAAPLHDRSRLSLLRLDLHPGGYDLIYDTILQRFPGRKPEISVGVFGNLLDAFPCGFRHDCIEPVL